MKRIIIILMTSLMLLSACSSVEEKDYNEILKNSMNHFENISPEGIQTWFTDQLPQHRIQENQQINFAFNLS